jgi:hypothetical protein
MAESNVRARGVDVLFGDSEPVEPPPYVIETKVKSESTPPAVASSAPFPTKPTSEAAIPAQALPPSPAPSPRVQPTLPHATPQFMPPPPPPTTAAPSRASQPTPLDPLFGLSNTFPTRTSPGAAFSKDQSPYALYLSDMIRHLYEEVTVQLADSPTVSDYCMGVLLKSREAYQSGNYPLAEFYAESVDAKLKRSAKSVHASSGLGVLLLWFWQFLMLAFGGLMIGITYIPSLTLFDLLVNPDLLIGMRIVGWGIVGGVISAVYNMPRFVQFREYDPAYAMNYFSRPLQGLLAGALIFLISQSFLAGTIRPDSNLAPTGPPLLYILSAFVGFGQQYVWEFFDSLLRAIFRNPTGSSGLNPPRPPA